MRRQNTTLVRIAAAILRPVFRFGMRLRVEGVERVPDQGPVLLVSNHRSVLDPPLIAVAQLPGRLHFMAKKELFRGPFGWLISRGGAFPVDRGGADRDAIRTAREVLAAGECLLMFPEGTRSRTDALGAAWPGAGSLGLAEGVTVIPVGVTGSDTWRRTGVVVRFGPPIDLSGLEGSKGARSQAAADAMMDGIRALVGPEAGGTA